MNFKEIIEAWVIANNPTELQLELAEKRNTICDTCPSKKTITKKLKIGVVCGECGCPIPKKIFTNSYNPCPLEKWKEVDDDYFLSRKSSKTLL